MREGPEEQRKNLSENHRVMLSENVHYDGWLYIIERAGELARWSTLEAMLHTTLQQRRQRCVLSSVCLARSGRSVCPKRP